MNLSTAGNFLSNNYGVLLATEGSASAFNVGDPAFIGFQFDAGDGIQYGWAEVTLETGGDNPFTIERFAFGSAGEAVAVGQTVSVPEPSSLGLLALGAVGVLSTRRRKKTALAN